MGLSLRPATEGDSERLLEWRNDPQTRAMAVVQAAVARAAHERWLAVRLADADTLLTIVEDDGAPAGTGEASTVRGRERPSCRSRSPPPPAAAVSRGPRSSSASSTRGASGAWNA